MRRGFWTVGYHPDDPIEWVYACVPTPLSFNDRPELPVHTYHTYAYDPIADKMLYALDARKKLRMAKDHPLQDGDIVKIVSAAR